MKNSQLATGMSTGTGGSAIPVSQIRASQPAVPILQQLRQKIRAVETENRRDKGSLVKNGCAAIDRLLPDGGYSRGTLIQWISAGGLGAEYLSLRVAQQACLEGGALVIADPRKEFFPPAAAAMGIDLNHLIVLQTDNEKDLLWGIDQALRCSAVAAVWGWLEVIEERQFRRFQLSAESSGALGLFVQPYRAARQPSWAEVQWLVGMQPFHSSESHSIESESASNESEFYAKSLLTNKLDPSKLPVSELHLKEAGATSERETASFVSSASRSLSLQLARCRGTHTGKAIRLALNPVTGAMEPLAKTLPLTPVKNSSLSKTSMPDTLDSGRPVYEKRSTSPLLCPHPAIESLAASALPPALPQSLNPHGLPVAS
jgi:protein ImuA